MQIKTVKYSKPNKKEMTKEIQYNELLGYKLYHSEWVKTDFILYFRK